MCRACHAVPIPPVLAWASAPGRGTRSDSSTQTFPGLQSRMYAIPFLMSGLNYGTPSCPAPSYAATAAVRRGSCKLGVLQVKSNREKSMNMREPGGSIGVLLLLALIFMVQAVFETDFALLPSGELTIGRQADCRMLVRLTPKETYALLMFLRLPGVAELIEEQVGTARQDQNWHEYEADGVSDT
jgi:hypothetical protein